jgi:hypothetical protein
VHVSRGNFLHRGAAVAEDGDRRRKAALIAVSTEQHHDAWIAMLWKDTVAPKVPRATRALGNFATNMTVCCIAAVATIGVLVCVAIAGSMRSRDRKMELGRIALRR